MMMCYSFQQRNMRTHVIQFYYFFIHVCIMFYSLSTLDDVPLPQPFLPFQQTRACVPHFGRLLLLLLLKVNC